MNSSALSYRPTLFFANLFLMGKKSEPKEVNARGVRRHTS